MPREALLRGLRLTAFACGAGSVVEGMAVLAAWALGFGPSTAMVSTLPPMMPNTALMVALSGAALCFRVPENPTRGAVAVARSLAVAVLALAGHALVANALNLSGLPFRRLPAPQTAAALVLLAGALLAFERRTSKGNRPAEGLALAAGSIATVSALGHLFRVGLLVGVPGKLPEVGMALPTLTAILALSFGVGLARPEAGVMGSVTSVAPGGSAARPMLLGLLLIGPIIALIALGARRGWFDASLTAALVAFLGLAWGAASILTTARRLDREAESRRRSEERTRELFDQASDGIFIADVDGRYTDVNAAGCRIFGYSREEILGRTIMDMIASEDLPRLLKDREDFLRGETRVSEWSVRRKDGTPLDIEVSAKILPDGRWQAFVRDISERRKTEESLRQASERIDLALRGADLAAWDWNVKTGDVSFNPRWAEMRGYRPEEILPRQESFMSGVHPEDLPRVRKALDDHFQGRGEYEVELRVRTKTGGWIWILDRGRIFARDEDGNPVRMAGTELDITGRKRAEEELRRLGERERFRLALEAAANAMVVVGRDGRVAFANSEAERLFGWSRNELTGRIVDVLVPERFRRGHAALRDAFFREAGGKRPMGVARDLFAVRKDGSEFPIEISLTKVEDVEECVVVASVSDISRRKEAETALRESEQRFRLLVQGTRDYAIFMQDTQGLISIWNEGAERILGYRGEEIQGGSYARFYLPEDVARGKPDADLRTAVDRGSFEEEAWRVRKDGTRFWAGVLITPLTDPGGRIIGYGKVIRDLSEKRRAREELLETDARLRRSVMELESFAYSVAHDLRAPLRALEGYATILADRLGDRVDPESRAMLERMGRVALRLDHLIRDLLSYSAIAREAVVLEAVELDPLVEHVIAHYPYFARARPRIRGPLGRARAQPSLLLQVLANLLDNAVRYVPRDRVPDVEVWAERRGDGKVRLAVQDNGPGIPRDAWQRVFEPFVSLARDDDTGTGIGLAIVKKAVERMGGRVLLESEPERGCRFWIELEEA